jgi:hypothetical protein
MKRHRRNAGWIRRSAVSRATAEQEEDQENRDGNADEPEEDPTDFSGLVSQEFSQSGRVEWVCFHNNFQIAASMPSRHFWRNLLEMSG